MIPIEKIKNFKEKKGHSPLFLKFTDKFSSSDIIALPKTMVIGKGGKMLYEKTGEITESAKRFAERLKALIQ